MFYIHKPLRGILGQAPRPGSPVVRVSIRGDRRSSDATHAAYRAEGRERRGVHRAGPVGLHVKSSGGDEQDRGGNGAGGGQRQRCWLTKACTRPPKNRAAAQK